MWLDHIHDQLGWSSQQVFAQKRTLGGLKLLRSILPPRGNEKLSVQWGKKNRKAQRAPKSQWLHGYTVRQEKNGLERFPLVNLQSSRAFWGTMHRG